MPPNSFQSMASEEVEKAESEFGSSDHGSVVTPEPSLSHEKTKTPQNPLATPDFPEGGWKGWAAVAGSFCIQMCGFGSTPADIRPPLLSIKARIKFPSLNRN
ncbi:hypothetical protein P691DRAFT_784421 [Macrolepiota fuliginosa MF-IS2]|uniref:Uncharacterized protein n=1 Tax=Macrolepiota fuliginosa MF-IS2 TaxID=1400762 RepID=A0A9P6BUF9_9AGAR|nr:hypothetical protein P691DRAFT_784421 [Macrolepiota fuliginosa MF-IS2]